MMRIADILALRCGRFCQDVRPYHSFAYDIADINAFKAQHEASNASLKWFEQHHVSIEAAGDMHAGRAHVVCEEQIGAALTAHGISQGRNHVGGGWSDWGPPEYAPPIAGFVITWKTLHEWSADGGKTWTWDFDIKWDPERVKIRTRPILTLRHAGKGRKEAHPRYVEALRDFGFVCDIGLPDPEIDKQPVVIVDAVDLDLFRARIALKSSV